MIYKRISVCIATYNGEKFIEKQLNSILKQLSKDDEIIISDDYSSDNTLKIINKFNDNRILIFYNNGEKGYTSNFENALTKASGKYIFLSDQDDIWLDNKVSCCLKYLKQYDMVISDAIIINENDNLKYTSFFSQRKSYKNFIGNVYKFGFLGCCFTFNRNVLKRAIPFPPNHKLATHDNWLFLVGSLYYKIKIIDYPLIEYRRHGLNISSGGMQNNTSWKFKIRYRLYLLLFLFKRNFTK